MGPALSTGHDLETSPGIARSERARCLPSNGKTRLTIGSGAPRLALSMGLVLRILGASALAVAALALPAAASGAVLYEQMSVVGPPEVPSNTPSMSYTEPNDVEGADDFTIPAGQTWTI